MSTKEHLKSSETATANSEPELSLVGQPKGEEDSAMTQTAGKPATLASKDKISPSLGGSPDRYRGIRTLIQI